MALKVVNVNGLELEAFSTQWFQVAGEWSKRLSRLWLDFQSSNHINAIWSNPCKEQLKHKSCHCPELPGFTAWVDSICFKQGQTWLAPMEKSEWFCLIAWTLYVCPYALIYTHIYIYISSQKLIAWWIFLNTHVFFTQVLGVLRWPPQTVRCCFGGSCHRLSWFCMEVLRSPSVAVYAFYSSVKDSHRILSTLQRKMDFPGWRVYQSTRSCFLKRIATQPDIRKWITLGEWRKLF